MTSKPQRCFSWALIGYPNAAEPQSLISARPIVLGSIWHIVMRLRGGIHAIKKSHLVGLSVAGNGWFLIRQIPTF
jgi:hypothetical protein